MDTNILFNKITNYNGLIFFLEYLNNSSQQNNSSTKLNSNDLILFDNFLTYFIFDAQKNISVDNNQTLINKSIDEIKYILISKFEESIYNIMISSKIFFDDSCDKFNIYCNYDYNILFETDLYISINTLLTNNEFKKYDKMFDSNILKNNIKLFIDNYILNNNLINLFKTSEINGLNECIGHIFQLIDEIYTKIQINSFIHDEIGNNIETIFNDSVAEKKISLKFYDYIMPLKNKISIQIITFLKQKQSALNICIKQINNIKTEFLNQIIHIIKFNTKYEFIKYYLNIYSDSINKLIDNIISNITFYDNLDEKIINIKKKIELYHKIFSENIKINHIDTLISSLKNNTSSLISQYNMISKTNLHDFQIEITNIINKHITQIKNFFEYDVFIYFLKDSKIIKNIYFRLESSEYNFIKSIQKIYQFDSLLIIKIEIIKIFTDEYNNYKKNILTKIDDLTKNVLLEINTLSFEEIIKSVDDFINNLINLKSNINEFSIISKNNLSKQFQKYLSDLIKTYTQKLNNISYDNIKLIYDQMILYQTISDNFFNIIHFNCEESDYLNLEFISDYCNKLKSSINDINYFLFLNNNQPISDKLKLIFEYFLNSNKMVQREYNTYNFIKYLSQINSILNKKIDEYKKISEYSYDKFFSEYKKIFKDSELIISKNEFDFPTKIISLKNKLIIFFLFEISYNDKFIKLYSDIISYKKLSNNDPNKQIIILSINEYIQFLLNDINKFDFKISYDTNIDIRSNKYMQNKQCLFDNLLFYKFFTNTTNINSLLEPINIDQFFFDNYIGKYIIPIISVLNNNLNFKVQNNIKFYNMFKLAIK